MQTLEDVYRELQEQTGTEESLAPAIAAAVSVLWRHVDTLQVYLVKRSPTLRFLPGFWTFPGGKADPSDASLRNTAVRELEEETGVVSLVENLAPAGRWITPDLSPLRFDTHFFLQELPSSAEADFKCSGGELEDGAWLDPKTALAEFEGGRMLLPAPILSILQALSSGIQGGAQRAIQASMDAEMTLRLWAVSGGIAVSPLKTPTLPPATRTNCYVVGTDELILIDPGSPHLAEREALCHALDQRLAQGHRLKEIWLTHHHGDHVGAAEYLSEKYQIPICAHERTAELLLGICRVDQHLRDGERRILTGSPERELECMFTPGHAAGHLCFYEHHTKALIVGDMLASVGTILVDPVEGDMTAYLASLRRLRDREGSMLLPAHGFAIADATGAIDHYIAHRNMRESKVLAALNHTLSGLDTLVTIVYADTPTQLHRLAQRSLLSHLIKLEREGVAQKEKEQWRLV